MGIISVKSSSQEDYTKEIKPKRRPYVGKNKTERDRAKSNTKSSTKTE